MHNDKERRRWQDPEAILDKIGLHAGLTFVDVGCGDGFFAIPAARLLGERGKVLAIDANDEAIDRLDKKAKREGLSNIAFRVGEAEDTILCKRCADIVFFGIVLHDFKDPLKVLRNAKVMLKPSGRLVDLDWKKDPMEMGPPLEIRFSEQEAVSLMKSAGFEVESVKESGQYHYVIIGKP